MCVFRGRTNSVKRPFDGTGFVSNLTQNLKEGQLPPPPPGSVGPALLTSSLCG